MRVFKTKWFTRFARKEDISDSRLVEAVREIETGLNDGELGRGIIKKRVARKGEGKRGGYRTIIVYRTRTIAVFVYGFPKSTKANLTAQELEAYQRLAKIYLALDQNDIANAMNAGELMEVQYHGQEI
ncbi:MAG: type II toxin-antitoxin system RelE/ParE family toxin [Desulfobacteraceae bacterium]|nr:type II toxin-antitoxin system RelE/ParE family toxin [Desulfobacteraceae bacterium]